MKLACASMTFRMHCISRT